MKTAYWILLVIALLVGQHIYLKVDAKRAMNAEMEWQRQQAHEVTTQNTKYQKENKHLVYLIAKNRKEKTDARKEQ